MTGLRAATRSSQPESCERGTYDDVRKRNGKKSKKVETVVEGPVIANHQDIVVPAALQGLGILYAYNDDGIAEALERGRLKRVLVDWTLTMPGLFLYYSNRRHVRPALRAFIDCLLDRDGSKRPNQR